MPPPVVIVDVISSKGTVKQGNLLLDSGAEISLIRRGFAEELRLKGTPITITMVNVSRFEKKGPLRFSAKAPYNKARHMK